MTKILVVDDKQAIRSSLRDVLEYEHYKVEEAINGLDCLVKMKESSYDIVLMDVMMPKMDGMEALERIRLLAPDTPVIMISAHSNIEKAVKAVRKGAFDFIAKPLDLNRLLITVRNALDKSSLITETKVLHNKISGHSSFDIIGDSKKIKDVKNMIDIVAKTNAKVLITGSNGTGKELVARQIHAKSDRAKKTMIEVNCAAIPSELIESELFGHEKGSFTSANKQRIGKFEQANQGTLFLDEIGDMSLPAQAKVLKALEEGKITRVGSNKEIKVDVRVIAATNKDLEKEIDEGNFRQDLYHRLNIIQIHVPSLDERKEDIPLLINHFLKIVTKSLGVGERKITKEAIIALQNKDWPGNIRELRNSVERLVILGGNVITDSDVIKYVLKIGNRGNGAIKKINPNK